MPKKDSRKTYGDKKGESQDMPFLPTSGTKVPDYGGKGSAASLLPPDGGIPVFNGGSNKFTDDMKVASKQGLDKMWSNDHKRDKRYFDLIGGSDSG